MNELEKALEDVLDYGMKVIDNLTPEQLAEVQSILGDIKYWEIEQMLEFVGQMAIRYTYISIGVDLIGMRLLLKL